MSELGWVSTAARLGSVWVGWNIEEGSGPGLLIQDILQVNWRQFGEST